MSKRGTLAMMTGLDQLAALIRTWNASIRLVGDDQPTALQRHFDDALAVVPLLPPDATVVDVGSGNGLPALPIALARPDLTFTLVEPIAKKVAFLRACRRALELTNVTVRRGRDEDVSAEATRFDVAISQATFAPAEWLQRGAALVVPGGLVIAMAAKPPPELDRLGFELEVHQVETSDGRARTLILRHVDGH